MSPVEPTKPTDKRPLSDSERRKRRGIKYALIVAGMVAFAFINVPLFRTFCAHEGLIVTLNESRPASTAPENAKRNIDVLWNAMAAPGLPITLTPKDPEQTIHPNERSENHFTFVNTSDKTVRFRAIHAIFPSYAATHMALIQCFCFENHTLGPHGTVTLPVIYQINRGMNKNVHRVSVMYTLEPLAAGVAAKPLTSTSGESE